MKNSLLILLTMVISIASFSQSNKAENYLKFKQKEYDFGKIKQGSIASFDFLFDNISQENVVVESVTAACGCMISYKPEAAVAKGKSEKIKAEFSAGKPGPFTRTITVKLVDVQKPIILILKGEVLPHEEFLEYEKQKKDSVF